MSLFEVYLIGRRALGSDLIKMEVGVQFSVHKEFLKNSLGTGASITCVFLGRNWLLHLLI